MQFCVYKCLFNYTWLCCPVWRKRCLTDLAVEVFGDKQVLFSKACRHLLLLLQAPPYFKLLLGQVIYVLLQCCKVSALRWHSANGQAVSQRCRRAHPCMNSSVVSVQLGSRLSGIELSKLGWDMTIC